MDKVVAVVGLGYVGLPLALAFSRFGKTIGFDIDNRKIEEFRQSTDSFTETNLEAFESAGDMLFTNDPSALAQADYILITVPTPVNEKKFPDLSILENACKLVGRNMVAGTIVIFESTVYPGVTEEICVPILRDVSGLTNDSSGFRVGYSPERINPGDTDNKLETIVKVVSGQDAATTVEVRDLYAQIISAGLHVASSIRVAEASKVIENAQRDVNIAFMNELSLIFDKMGIDTLEVLEAAGTKWNFAPYRPGLVGGHCIGIDPYYLIYKANMLGVDADFTLLSRQINESIAKSIAEKVEILIEPCRTSKQPRIGVLGVTFKEDCNDFRNSKVFDLIDELKLKGYEVVASDPLANKAAVFDHHNISLTDVGSMEGLDAVILAVAHSEYKNLYISDYLGMCTNKILLDLKGIYSKREFEQEGFVIWRM